ncbi:MAG: hypothetical protein OXM02_05650 [Bacteroidota bacterium]|nr:hypothetical protein [Bacteroidota bacterium]
MAYWRFGRTWLPLLVLIPAGAAAAQVRTAEFEVHDRGDLWDTMKDDGTLGAPSPGNLFEFFPSMDWPGGPAILLSKDEQRSYNFAGGTWIGGRREDGSLFFVENGPFAFRDQGTYAPMEKVNNFIEETGYDPAQPEQTITATWTTSADIRVVRTSRAWSFPSLKDFIVIHYALTNQAGAAMSDIYVGFPYLLRPSYQDVLAHNGWGGDFNRADELAAYDEAHRMMYVWDDTPNFDLPTDVGNYLAAYDELRTPGYAGVALLDAPVGAAGQTQPAYVLTAQLLNYENRLTLTSTTTEDLYAVLSGADRSLQAPADERLVPFMLMSCGPYRLESGATLSLTLVQAVNGLPIDRALDGLDAQPLLPAGLDSLRHTVDRARSLAGRNFEVASVPPPSPPIQILPLPVSQSISLTWDPLDATWIDPLNGQSTFREYRVFRSERAFTGPYRPVARVRPDNSLDRRRYWAADLGKWRFIDNRVSLGVGYFYSVIAIDSEGDESWFTNRNAEAVTVASSPAADAMNVRVFPNPFRLVSGFPTSGEESTIVWTNLPPRATIRIYTSAGELFKVIEHDDPYTGQAVWDQLSDSRQRVAPGIYFWTVQSDVGTAKGSLLIVK